MSALQELNISYKPENMDVKFMGKILDHILLFGCRSKFNKTKEGTRFEPEIYYLYNTTIHKASECFMAHFNCFQSSRNIYRYDANDTSQYCSSSYWSYSKQIDKIGSAADVIYYSHGGLLLFRGSNRDPDNTQSSKEIFTAIDIHTMNGLYNSDFEHRFSTEDYHIFNQGRKQPYECHILTKSFEIYSKKDIWGRWISGNDVLIALEREWNIYNIDTDKYRFPTGEKHRITMHDDIIEIDDKIYIRKMNEDNETVATSNKYKYLYDANVGDYTIVFADGSKRNVVSYILSIASEYFRAIFESKIATNIIDFKDHNKDTIIDILKYIYYHDRTNSTDLHYLFELHKIVKTFGLDDYLSYIENKILSMKTVDNIKNITLLCIKYQADSLLEKI